MLKSELENCIKETTAIKTDIKWIRGGVDKIDKQLNDLNGSVDNTKLKTDNHETRIKLIEEDIKGREEQEQKIKWFKKEHIWSIIGAIITGLIFVLITQFL